MGTVVQLKRSETTGAIPTAGDIAVAELAINLADGALYTKKTDGTIIEIGVSQDVPVFFADEVDLGDLSGTGETYDMGGLDGGSPSGGGGIQLSALSVTDSGGDGSLSYDNTTGVFTYTGPSASDVRAHFSAGTGITITDGAVATTITQYTDALARGAVSVTDSGGDGSLSYNSTTGVITYTGPSSTDVRAHFSAGSGITITNGAVAVDSTIATKTYADNAATTAVAAAIDAAPATLDTLNELAAALGDDANFSTTITTSIGTKLNSSAVSAFGLTLVDDADAATARTTLGLGNVTNESKATMFSSPTFTGTAVLPSTTSIGDVSSTELGYLDGVTSAIQTQLNAKANTSSLATVATSGSYNDLSDKPSASGVTTGKAIAMAIVFGG